MLAVVGCQVGCGSVKVQVVCGQSPTGLSCLGCMESFSNAQVRGSASLLIRAY